MKLKVVFSTLRQRCKRRNHLKCNAERVKARIQLRCSCAQIGLEDQPALGLLAQSTAAPSVRQTVITLEQWLGPVSFWALAALTKASSSLLHWPKREKGKASYIDRLKELSDRLQLKISMRSGKCVWLTLAQK